MTKPIYQKELLKQTVHGSFFDYINEETISVFVDDIFCGTLPKEMSYQINQKTLNVELAYSLSQLKSLLDPYNITVKSLTFNGSDIVINPKYVDLSVSYIYLPLRFHVPFTGHENLQLHEKILLPVETSKSDSLTPQTITYNLPIKSLVLKHIEQLSDKHRGLSQFVLSQTRILTEFVDVYLSNPKPEDVDVICQGDYLTTIKLTPVFKVHNHKLVKDRYLLDNKPLSAKTLNQSTQLEDFLVQDLSLDLVNKTLTIIPEPVNVKTLSSNELQVLNQFTDFLDSKNYKLPKKLVFEFIKNKINHKTTTIYSQHDFHNWSITNKLVPLMDKDRLPISQKLIPFNSTYIKEV